MRAFSLLALLPAILLAACSAGECDPNTAGLFTGIGCSAGSGYATRTDTLTQQASSAQAQSVSSYHNAVAAQQSYDQANAQVASLQQQLADLNVQLNADQRQLNNLHAANAQQAQEVANVQSEIDRLKARTAAQQGQPSEAQVQQLQQEQDQEKRDLLNLSSQM
jgi:chromosome segregation ATPase